VTLPLPTRPSLRERKGKLDQIPLLSHFTVHSQTSRFSQVSVVKSGSEEEGEAGERRSQRLRRGEGARTGFRWRCIRLLLTYTPRTIVSFRLFAFLLTTLLLPFPSFAKDPATIVRVVDGDTVEIMLKGQKEKVGIAALFWKKVPLSTIPLRCCNPDPFPRAG